MCLKVTHNLSTRTETESPPFRMSPACILSIRLIRTTIQVNCMNVMTYVIALRGSHTQVRGTLEPITPVCHELVDYWAYGGSATDGFPLWYM